MVCVVPQGCLKGASRVQASSAREDAAVILVELQYSVQCASSLPVYVTPLHASHNLSQYATTCCISSQPCVWSDVHRVTPCGLHHEALGGVLHCAGQLVRVLVQQSNPDQHAFICSK